MATYTVEVRLCNGMLLAERDSQTATEICQLVSSVTAIAPHAMDIGVAPDAGDRPPWRYMAGIHGRDTRSAVNALHSLYDYLDLKPAERVSCVGLKAYRMH
ncbi:hypothetical protein [Burkholderia ubonensis]|uniref:hypothetical protein n=1 Tax=Burkholderia ubonensis TaxID=101571 RepID=UPI0007575C91|nr:hypothetical protein [Burkholderia ubonensis]KVL70333.1 hypothetical protein WJ49_22740 [Burkholderia ubonensis]KVL73196.1 hypothetical protein WJ48_00435 [Burkholderia ubonensis]KVL91023.1 hypothetical protein WJ50_12870 [Burkholderia ubonensis]